MDWKIPEKLSRLSYLNAFPAWFLHAFFVEFRVTKIKYFTKVHEEGTKAHEVIKHPE
jgi:hypothetical protein